MKYYKSIGPSGVVIYRAVGNGQTVSLYERSVDIFPSHEITPTDMDECDQAEYQKALKRVINLLINQI